MSQRRLIILGTGSQAPTRERNHGGYLLRWDGQGFLFDPGEGVQRQMIHAGVSAPEITKIFISHFHGDHCLGLAGIIQRLSLDRVSHPVEIYYPASGQKYYENLRDASIYYRSVELVERPVSEPGVIFSDDHLTIETRPLSHIVDTWGYRIEERDGYTLQPDLLAAHGISGPRVRELQERGELNVDGRIIRLADVGVPRPGQAFAFVMDTRWCDEAVELARGADLVLSEATYLAERQREATDFGHLTAVEAGRLAREAGAGMLVMSHFSQRYQETGDLVSEAKSAFDHVIAARDGDHIDIPRRCRQL